MSNFFKNRNLIIFLIIFFLSPIIIYVIDIYNTRILEFFIRYIEFLNLFIAIFGIVIPINKANKEAEKNRIKNLIPNIFLEISTIVSEDNKLNKIEFKLYSDGPGIASNISLFYKDSDNIWSYYLAKTDLILPHTSYKELINYSEDMQLSKLFICYSDSLNKNYYKTVLTDFDKKKKYSNDSKIFVHHSLPKENAEFTIVIFSYAQKIIYPNITPKFEETLNKYFEDNNFNIKIIEISDYIIKFEIKNNYPQKIIYNILDKYKIKEPDSIEYTGTKHQLF